ncbi:2-amino-5-chloromuconic acid deaminase [subsurface metagenome]
MALPTLASLAADLESGRVTARKLVEECLDKIEDSSGEGARTFVSVDKQGAVGAADAMDRLRKANKAPSPFAGIPISIKDLFDVKGQVTRAGSRALEDAPAAVRDAPAVERLRRAGFVLIGRTNMTEFAYSGLGINPHYGTPKSAFRRDIGFVPGGSSSGAAISVIDGMSHGALGSDTGGSCRIPAAFNGLVGFKPTQRRVPREGVVPLSTSLDSIGPIARTVECCAALDAILADQPASLVKKRALKGLRLLVPRTVFTDGLDEAVSNAFSRSLRLLSEAGALIVEHAVPEFGEIGSLLANGGFTAAESYAWHSKLLIEKGETYDPHVFARIRRGLKISAPEYIKLISARQSLIERVYRGISEFDAILAPTTAIAAPRISDVVADPGFTEANARVLRNCTLINFIDGCAVSLPAHRDGEAPIGIMLSSRAGVDRELFDLAAAVEGVLRA